MIDLRGFSNFMIDLAEGRKELYELRDMIVDYYVRLMAKAMELGIDMMAFGDDLGHQDALPMSPKIWREFLKPAYTKIYTPFREKGIEVYMHTDGYIVDVIGDLIEAGVTILNPQDLVNGLDNLRKATYGKICIALDIDRQSISVFGSGRQLDEHILACIKTLGSPTGRLTMKYAVYLGTPKENVEVIALAMEKYHDYWLNRE